MVYYSNVRYFDLCITYLLANKTTSGQLECQISLLFRFSLDWFKEIYLVKSILDFVINIFVFSSFRINMATRQLLNASHHT